MCEEIKHCDLREADITVGKRGYKINIRYPVLCSC